MLHWIQHFFGFDTGQGNAPHYLFWSGFGSDLSELALVGAVAGLLRKHNCHVKGCPRIGRFPVDGTPWIVCRKHHPQDAPTHGEILASQERTP